MMPTAAPEKKTDKVFAETLCESCGARFSCGANVGECWCFTVVLNPQTLSNLRENYENCLCPGCLNKTKSTVEGC